MSVIARSENDEAIALRFLLYCSSLGVIREDGDCRDIHVSPHSGHYRGNDSLLNFEVKAIIIFKNTLNLKTTIPDR